MKIIALLLAVLTLSACLDEQVGIYTLYRNSNISVGDVKGEDMRIHIATFDSKDGADYNQKTCELTKSFFQSQKDVQTKFWCEAGKFKE